MSHWYKNLIVWQHARALAGEIYRITQRFPAAERYGLTAQLRRAAVSIASNIAEGQGRLTKGGFLQFLGHARGSLLEVETQLAIAVDLGFLQAPEYSKLENHTADVLKLLNGLIDSLKPKSSAAVA